MRSPVLRRAAYAWALAAAVVLVAPGGGALAQAGSAERVAAIRVHGNHTTPDEEILALAAVTPGDLVTPALATAVQQRLEETGRFRAVDVRQRYASLSDPTQVMLVIVIEERSGIRLDVPRPGVLRRVASSTMWLPVLRREDGYGLTYGARLSFVDLLGPRTRVSVPLTWGGERRAAAEVERTFAGGPLTRVRGTAGVWRREHPSAGLPERRIELAARAERAFAPWLRVGATASRANVWFDAHAATVSGAGLDLIVDTSRNPVFPRNALTALVAWERLWFEHAADTARTTLDVRGYVGLVGPSVLVLRAVHTAAAAPLPVYEQALLGGMGSLRGFRVGYRAGDRLAITSAELRLPVSSPLRVSRAGFTLFGETGTVYAAGATLSRARFDTGAGAGVFAQWPIATFRLEVAHGFGAGTRAHVSLGLSL